jgi:hypothetical protein
VHTHITDTNKQKGHINAPDLQVYDNRKSLALTLKDSQTVVAQVERAIYITLLLLLAFVTLAIFEPGRLQRTWTGLSAGLLSFSFIFGNSIRQVTLPKPGSGQEHRALRSWSSMLAHALFHFRSGHQSAVPLKSMPVNATLQR